MHDTHAIHEDVSRVLFSATDIENRVADLGDAITEDYAEAALNEGLVIVTVLKGAAIFLADLVRAIRLPVEMDFMAIASYGGSATSSGVIRILKDLSTDIFGKHVIIAEDIIDTGLTVKYLLKYLRSQGPASLEVATLLRKRRKDQDTVECRYMGFEVPDEFIVGYGLDFAERYRNLPYIAALKPEIYNAAQG